MNYAEWTADYVRFVNGLSGRLPGKAFGLAHANPPLTDKQLTKFEKSIGLKLPKAARDHMCLGSSSVTGTFQWTPPPELAAQLAAIGLPEHVFGGGVLCRTNSIEDNLEEVRELAEELDGPESDDDRVLLENCLPIIGSPSGEFVVLDLRSGSDDPAVHCVTVEGPCPKVAASFTAFLKEWSGVCYLGPEMLMLQPFLNAQTGLLDSHSTRAMTLRKLLAV